MQKLTLSNQPQIEDKINELIDELHELQDFIVKQNEMIAKQLELIKNLKEGVVTQTNCISDMKKQLPEVLRLAIKEQNIDIFQDWLNK